MKYNDSDKVAKMKKSSSLLGSGLLAFLQNRVKAKGKKLTANSFNKLLFNFQRKLKVDQHH
jgi:hypothetical protein